jgi:hypothetical protein
VVLTSPHVPLGISSAEAQNLLRGATPLDLEDGSLGFTHGGVEIALYSSEGVVTSVWYNDPAGRDSPAQRQRKVAAYLRRYGDPAYWERRMDNGWMHYWFNVPSQVAMVYGLHMDVVRFNQWQHPASSI